MGWEDGIRLVEAALPQNITKSTRVTQSSMACLNSEFVQNTLGMVCLRS